MSKHYLTPLFSPRSIVLFTGKTPDDTTAEARLVCKHLQEGGYTGEVITLDLDRQHSLSELVATHPDLAIIALPQEQTLTALDLAGRLHCRAAIILGSDIDADAASALRVCAQKHSVLLLGPNSLGLQRPTLRLNASALGPLAKAGSVALVSQSTALTASILDWSVKNMVGFSTVVSLGSDTAIDMADALDYLADDPATLSIVLYLETVENARRFMSALRAAAYTKPVIVLKTGHVTDFSDEVFDAALRRAGAVRVRSFVQLFSAAKCLTAPYRPRGRRLAIIANGAGPDSLAADRVTKLGLELPPLPKDVVRALRQVLPKDAKLDPVINLGARATASHYQQALSACVNVPTVDGILVILSPQPGLDPVAVAQALIDQQPLWSKQVLTCWMGDTQVIPARALLTQASIPTFRTPESAIDAFGNIATFLQNQQLLQQTPSPVSVLKQPDLEGARILLESILAERRTVLTEQESKALLSTFHIPVTPTVLTRTPNEAILIANQLGYPVALKIESNDIPCKSAVGGVILGIEDSAHLRAAWETIHADVTRLAPDAEINGLTVQAMSGKRHGREFRIDIQHDALFGPVISFGAGGSLSDVIADHAIELPPLNQFITQRLIERTRSAVQLDAWQGAPATNRTALEHVLLRISEMVCALPQLRQITINPVIVDDAGAVVVDARVEIAAVTYHVNTYHHLALPPYPSNQEQLWPLPGNRHYAMRPIRPDDATMLQEFMRSLSDQSRYYRFVSSAREHSPRMLARYTLIDYDREMALVALYKERKPTEDGGFVETERIIGVSRYVTNPDHQSCEFGLVVADNFNGLGLGTRLMRSLMDTAKQRGLSRVEGLVLSKNQGMLKLMRSLGFTVMSYEEDIDFKLCVKDL